MSKRIVERLLATVLCALALLLPACGYSLKEEDYEAVRACVGMTADEAQEVAEQRGMGAKFFDPYGTSLTKAMGSEERPEGLHESTVTDAEAKDSLFSQPTARFTLSYVDPSNEDQEGSRAEVEGYIGATAAEARGAAKDMGYGYSFSDADGKDVTNILESSLEGSAVATSTVETAQVRKGLLSRYTAVFSLSYRDSEWLASFAGTPLLDACERVKSETSRKYRVVNYPARVHDEEIRKSELGDDLVAMEVFRDKSELIIRAASAEYLALEQRLEGILPKDDAISVARSFVSDYDSFYVSDYYAEAMDESAWLVTGSGSEMFDEDNDDPADVEVSMTVSVTEDGPVVGDFEYHTL